jgi:hypothetical protein
LFSAARLNEIVAPLRRKEVKIRSLLTRSAHVPMWIAGIALCLGATAGTIAIVRSIPASYASTPDGGAPSKNGAAPSGSTDLAAAQSTSERRNRGWCSGCGVVESMRQIEPSGEEITIRFRDGGTIVLNEATRRSWQLGNRVIVIGGLNASGP